MITENILERIDVLNVGRPFWNASLARFPSFLAATFREASAAGDLLIVDRLMQDL